MRGRNERTFATDAGYVTELYASSINYLDAKGKWQAIDDTLIPANAPGFSLKNKANGYTAFLPTSLASPIRIALTSGSIDLQLAGADGAIASQGSTATYAGALNGVTLSYDARPDSLKETITLASAQAPSTFKYNLTLPAGWSAQTVTGGGIRILDAKGTNHAVLLAPFMVDALHQAAPSDALSMTLSGSSPHFAVTVAADKNWIAASSRAFPVVIDPTIWTNVNYYGGQDCFLENTSPSTSFCSSNGYTGTTDLVGYNGTKIDRAIYLFPFQTGYTHIAPNANILDAELDLTLAASTSGSAVATTVYPITQSWSDSGASWNNASTGVAWTAPGGTVGSALSTINVGPAAGAVAWYGLTQEIQNEVKGSAAIDGFLIRTANEGANAQLQFDNYNIAPGTDTRRPHLRIQWNAWGGLQPFFKFDGVKQLDDRMSIAVNVANGQLVVHNQDLAVRGVGLNLTVDRFYNSLSDLSWHLGNGWNLSAGCDVRVDIDDHDGVSLWTPDGYEVLYRNNGSGGYITPPGINADLVKNWDSTFTLTFHGSNTKYNFQTGGCLQNEKDRNGNTISMSYNGSLATITDTENRATTLTYASPIDSDFISQITDSASRTYKYTYDSNRNLISYVDANSNTTSYQYNANNQMSQIQDPRGNLVNFTYSSTYPQPLTQISYVNTACPGGTCNTNFAYNSGAGPCTTSGIWHNTVVTDANGHTTTYCYENRGHVLEVRDANNNQRSTSYNSNSNVTSLTDAVSSITQLTYDTNNNLTQMQSPPTASGQSPAVTSFVTDR